jgi:hypothetical protein
VQVQVQVQDGMTLITDGPFGEIKEAIGGYLPAAPMVSGSNNGIDQPP